MREIRVLINEIEAHYPVNEWKHNGYYIWPLLRIKLYMHWVKEEDNSRGTIQEKKISRFQHLKNIFRSVIDFLFIKKEIDNVYLGASSHGVIHNGKSYNRYFDPLMDKSKERSLYLSKAKSKEGVYKPERHLSFTNLLLGYSLVQKYFRISPDYSPYIKKLGNILQQLGCEIEGFEAKAHKFLKTVDRSYALSLYLLKKMSPKKVWVLCFYSADVLGVVLAAHKLSIPTADMQHGGQGKNHLAYNSWNNVPKEGYEALPDLFYTWDETSAAVINSWAEATDKHSAQVFGNPWVNGWQKGWFELSNYSWPDNLILYTLQPIGEPLEKYLLDAIEETKNEWSWWLRLHPRQMVEREEIESKLKKCNLLEHVNITDATNLALPEILTHAKVHLTKSSGCAIEAFQFGVPTILIDREGEYMYAEYVESDDLMSSYWETDTQVLVKKIKSKTIRN